MVKTRMLTCFWVIDNHAKTGDPVVCLCDDRTSRILLLSFELDCMKLAGRQSWSRASVIIFQLDKYVDQRRTFF